MPSLLVSAPIRKALALPPLARSLVAPLQALERSVGPLPRHAELATNVPLTVEFVRLLDKASTYLLPGTVLGDIAIARDRRRSAAARYEAVRRLVARYLSLRYVYLASPGLQARWSKVRSAFVGYCQEHGLSCDRAWEQLAIPAIFEIVHRDELGKVSLATLRPWLAKELRKEIERELLGRTADQAEGVEVPLASDPDNPERLAELEVTLALALATLDPVDAAILVEYAGGCDYRTLAEALGTTAAAVRKRVERARRKLRSLLGDELAT